MYLVAHGCNKIHELDNVAMLNIFTLKISYIASSREYYIANYLSEYIPLILGHFRSFNVTVTGLCMLYGLLYHHFSVSIYYVYTLEV